MTSEELIEKYGEQYRSLIEDSLRWLTESECWRANLKNPIDEDAFIESLIRNKDNGKDYT